MNYTAYNEWKVNQKVRSHWVYLDDAWRGMGNDVLQSRVDDIAQLLRENGVTYNVYAGSQEKDWPLDPLPFVVSSSEWAQLERGIIQRAELQSLLFKDIFGERKLISEGIIPADFIFAHPDWLPAAWPQELPNTPHIPFVGFDLTRSADGQWKVLADRVQNPSGAGYALQNRVVISKVFPSLYREAGVHRLVHWFRAFRAELKRMAPRNESGTVNENPEIVLLSPGPGHETWFEHSYLATYLGITLVRGHDLELRGDQIWVKALGGDRKVDVILRRVNDAWCDPLYWRADSLLGVPGLVRAVQAGTVAVVNPLGAGVLHNPGILSRLDKICKFFLNEELILPSLKTQWLGDAHGLQDALNNTQQLVFKRVFPDPTQETIFGRDLDTAGILDLHALLRNEPEKWVCQEESNHSVTPSWGNGIIEDRHVVLRAFACGNPNTGYRVMPGGLSRIGCNAQTLMVSNQYGGISKDTWILSTEPDKETLNREAVHAVGTQAHVSLPAAAAESLFWMGRYIERSLVLIRRFRELLSVEREDEVPMPLCAALYCATGGLWNQEECTRKTMHYENVLFAADNPGSLGFNLRWLAWNGRSLRGIISVETLALVQQLSDMAQVAPTTYLEQHLDSISTYLRALESTIADWNVDDPRHVFVQLGQKCEWLHISQATLSIIRTSSLVETARQVLELDRGAPPGLLNNGKNLLREALQDSRRPRTLVSTAEVILALLRRLPHSRDRLRERPEALTLRLLSCLALGELEGVPLLLTEMIDALQEKYLSAQAPQSIGN